MIWIVLAALGVPIWLVVGALAGALWSRSKFRHGTEVFACKVRIVSAPEDSGKWPRATTYARWVHDVLLVHAGLALVRVRVLPVADVDAPITSCPGVKLKGGDPVSIRLRLDDGSLAEVATPAHAKHMLVGPFLALEARPADETTK